jgi:1,2-diacylglycerol 3-alpha-glucosyltransferase
MKHRDAALSSMSALRIAVASSGLDHIRRGIESWANDLGAALQRSGAQVTLFQASGVPSEPWRHVLPCWRRNDPRTQRLLSITRKIGGWRYGFGSGYEIEQSTFALPLWAAIRTRYDILHVQDPWVARVLDVFHRKGWSRPRVILAHGTEETADELRKFSCLQHLAPCYLDEWKPLQPPGQRAFAVPNFIDTNVFRPGDREESRAQWGIPRDALVVLSVAALKKHHKRCDYLIREFAEFQKSLATPAMLVMAGGWEQETAEVVSLGKSLLGDSLLVLQSLDRARMPSLYQAADVFAIASLHEMMPIAVLEALSSGLPVTCNWTPVLEWMAGPAGLPQDLSQPGGLMAQWQRLADQRARAACAAAARQHAESTFSEAAVLRQIFEMYENVMVPEKEFVSAP